VEAVHTEEVMKALIGGIIGALLLGGVLLFVNGPRTPALAANGFAATAFDPNDPVIVSCGEGRQALVRPVAAGQRFSQIECVPAAATVMAPGLVPAAQTYPAYQTYATQPLERVVYRDRPVTRTRAASTTRYETVHKGRSWQKSALIIGGSAAGGAGLGAIVDGKSGAKKGAVIGGVGGLVYDLATRNK
jgi:hypothetical protein